MKKKIKAAGVFYICLAVVSLAVGVTTYTVMSKRLTKSIGDIEVPDIPNQGISVLNNENLVIPDDGDKEQDKTKDTITPPKTDEKADEKPDNGDDAAKDQTPSGKGGKVWYNTPLSGTVSSDFSDSTLVFSPTMMDYRAHMGIDIAASVGTPVRAAADGVISRIYEDDMLGMTVEITHADGRVSRYCNLSPTLSADCMEEAAITALTVIGSVGETAASESAQETHLHFEIIENGVNIDPTEIIG